MGLTSVSLTAQKIDSLNMLFEKKAIDTAVVGKINLWIAKLFVENKIFECTYFDKAINISDSVGYPLGLANAHLNYFEYSKKHANYPEALRHSLKALKFFEILNDDCGKCKSHRNIGIVYTFDNKIDEAICQFNLALLLSEKCSVLEKANCLNSLGWLYRALGKNEKALEYHNQALKVLENTGDFRVIGRTHLNKAVAYREKKEFENALSELKLAIDYFEKSNFIWGKVLAMNNIGLCFSKLKKHKEAIEIQQKALPIALNAGDKENIANIYYGLYMAYNASGNYKLALENYLYLKAIEDSVFDQDRRRQLSELHALYENSQKENEIKILQRNKHIRELELKQKSNQFILANLTIAILLIIGGFLFWLYKNRQKQLLSETIFKTEMTERLRIAKDMHDELGSSLTKILIVSEAAMAKSESDNHLKASIEVINETVKDLSSNIRDFVWTLNPENNTLENLIIKLREFSSDILDEAGIDFNFDFTEEFSTLQLTKAGQRNIYLACKEIVNNTIKHANAIKFHFSIQVSDNELCINISDNGRGFDIAKKNHTGNGIKNITNRISDIGGKVEIKSSDLGTNIFASIPLKCIKEYPERVS